MSSRLKTTFSIAIPLLLTITISYYLQNLVITNQEQFTGWLSQFGKYIILVYIILQAVTIIIAPIGGAFLLITMIALFGPELALTIMYCVTTPCYLVNFYLSKKYGRTIAQKIIGEDSLKKMDRFVLDSGTLMLVVLKVFLSSNFDYLSYALGLTKISFKTFAVVNILGGIPAAFIMYLIFSRSIDLTQGVFTAYVVGLLFTGIVFVINNQVLKKAQSPRRGIPSPPAQKGDVPI